MTLAFWCVLIAGILPYGLAALSKTGHPYDNARPRVHVKEGWQQRADWAQQNAWESFAPFAAAVLIAHWLRAPQSSVDGLALVFIGFRLAHAAAYLANRPTLRSLAFVGGFACVIGLYVVGARAAG